MTRAPVNHQQPAHRGLRPMLRRRMRFSAQLRSVPGCQNGFAWPRAQLMEILEHKDPRLRRRWFLLQFMIPKPVWTTRVKLKALADEVADALMIVMHVLLRKTAKTVGWKGYIDRSRHG